MKRVLLSAYACAPNQGSEEGNGWNYATLLSRGGFEIHCLTQAKNRPAIEAALQAEEYPGLQFHYVAVPSWPAALYRTVLGIYVHYIYWQWRAYKVARDLERRHPFDLIHHATYGSAQLGSFLYKLRKPLIFGPIGGGQRAPSAFRRYFGRYWRREQIRDYISLICRWANPGYFHTIRQATQVIVTNADTYSMVTAARGGRPIHRLLDAGLAPAIFPPEAVERAATSRLNLLWVGRLMPRKALELTIEAFGRVDSSLPIRLTIVGGQGEMNSEVEEYINKYGVRGRVEWVGQIPYPEVKAHYIEADAFIFTSLRDSCPMQILEAMAYSLPVITLALHGQSELVTEEFGIKVAAEEPELTVQALANAIKWMCEHPDERQQMGRAARAFARSQVWPLKIRKFIEEWYPLAMGMRAAIAYAAIP